VGALTIVDFDVKFPGATTIVRLFSLKKVLAEIAGHRESPHDASIEFEDTGVFKLVSKFTQA
jgi:hypothetical protein